MLVMGMDIHMSGSHKDFAETLYDFLSSVSSKHGFTIQPAYQGAGMYGSDTCLAILSEDTDILYWLGAELTLYLLHTGLTNVEVEGFLKRTQNFDIDPTYNIDVSIYWPQVKTKSLPVGYGRQENK